MEPEHQVLYDANSDERSMATLAHALQIIGAWIAPLIIWLIRRESKFVSFHALQALCWQICVLVCSMFFIVGWFGVIFFIVFHTAAASSTHPNAEPPWELFVVAPLVWMFWMAVVVTNIILAIVYAIKASRGEWADYPVIGGRVRRWMHLPPRTVAG